jgi:peptidoglycan-associated lipoprotein
MVVRELTEMIQLNRFSRGWRVALLVAVGLTVAACAKGPDIAGIGGAGAGATTPGSAQDFIVNVGDRIFFETDSTDLTPTALATLDRQAEWLRRYAQIRVMIEGHADERGTREYNISLGARRASATRNYLIGRGVAAERMNVISYGKERPVAVCNDISCWSQNRRAVTVIQNAGS